MTYACETCTLKNNNENRQRIADRRILRNIYRTKRDSITKQYRSRSNREVK